jgi:hypothetical protein
LSLLVILLRLPSLELPFENDSGANAYHARLILRGEPLYGTHHPSHHLPAVYYTYALAFLLFGDSLGAVKLLLLVWNIAATYLLYRLGALLWNRATGGLAAVFYAILMSSMWMYGASAEIELFANLPRIAAVYVLMYLVIRRSAAWKFVFVGLLGAVSFLYKAVYLSPLAMAGGVLLVEWWQTRRSPGAWRTLALRGAWIGAGVVAGLAPVVVYFGLLGLLPRLMLVFTLGFGYVDYRNANSPYWVFYPIVVLMTDNILLLIFSLAGFVTATVSQYHRFRFKHGQAVSSAVYIAAWYVLSFAEADVTHGLFPHYFLLIIPSLALLAAWFLLQLYEALRSKAGVGGRLVVALSLSGLLTVTLLVSAVFNFSYYDHYARYRLGLETYRDFLLEGWSPPGPQLVRLQEVADYIKAHTTASDYIYYWSDDVQLYYLADRRCPIDIIWMHYIEATGPRERVFGPQTKYIVVDNTGDYPHPAWLYDNLAGKYTLETAIENQDVYRRTD